MKLYLSSQGVGENGGDLLRMVGQNTRTAVVANAVDHYEKHSRQTRVRKEKQALRAVGLQPEELDLRRYFGNPKALEGRLALYGLLWIRGGNVFNLRRAMQHSGFDEAALGLIANGEIVYGGYSAALAIAGPDLFGSELVDNPHDIPSGYPAGPIPDSALGLVDYYLAPHYETEMPWRQAVLNYVDHLKANNREVVCLRDGQVHIIEQATGQTGTLAPHAGIKGAA
jgi:dipeptidase E